MRNFFIVPIAAVLALLAVLGTAYALAASDTVPQSPPPRALPADVEGWHSMRRDARAATPSAMPAVSDELDPALQRLDGVTGHG